MKIVKKILMILATSIVLLVSVMNAQEIQATQANEQSEFIKEVNNIRHLKGLKPVSYSNDLQKLTDKHAKVIKEHCQLIREENMYISALGRVSVIARCKGKMCRLTPMQSYTQTLTDEAWSLAYRKNNIYSLRTSQIGVSFVECKQGKVEVNKTFVIILTN